MTERHAAGVIDTCVYIGLDSIPPAHLPDYPDITTITLAELHQGVAMAKNAVVRAARVEKLGAAVVDFDPLPFDSEAAARYGSLVTLTLAADRDPKPRRMDLLIAAIASSRGLPLFTRNADDFKGLESLLTIVPV
ncbi:type II toxin-antitoxin system VapC family toxin [Nonomuraea roseola]|uniref:Type II toxin-antitoxin system VapC family toxin n=1 Tax=Nonomuraea roseola TaxID=46179 RepID=A0ABV5PRH5_9ACTN